jgi:hypothetical protein
MACIPKSLHHVANDSFLPSTTKEKIPFDILLQTAVLWLKKPKTKLKWVSSYNAVCFLGASNISYMRC